MEISKPKNGALCRRVGNPGRRQIGLDHLIFEISRYRCKASQGSTENIDDRGFTNHFKPMNNPLQLEWEK